MKIANNFYKEIRKHTFSKLEKGLLIILSIFFIGVVIFFNEAHNANLQKGKTSLYLNPTLSLLQKKDLIVDFQELRELLTNRYEQRDDYLVSIYFEYFPTGANIAINKDEKIWPASLIKIPVAMAIMKKVQDKKWKLSNDLVILDGDKDRDYGEMYKEPSGTTLSIQKFLEESLIKSDNTAHFVLLRNLESSELEDIYVHLGMDDVINALKKAPSKKEEEDNRITAKRYSIFFRSLYNATYLDQMYSEKFLEILSRAPRDLAGTGIPENVHFVHKTGVRADEAVYADSGIVYAQDRPYMLTVMVQKKGGGELNEKEVASLFKDIGHEVYTYVTQAH